MTKKCYTRKFLKMFQSKCYTSPKKLSFLFKKTLTDTTHALAALKNMNSGAVITALSMLEQTLH